MCLYLFLVLLNFIHCFIIQGFKTALNGIFSGWKALKVTEAPFKEWDIDSFFQSKLLIYQQQASCHLPILLLTVQCKEKHSSCDTSKVVERNMFLAGSFSSSD